MDNNFDEFEDSRAYRLKDIFIFFKQDKQNGVQLV